MVKKSPKLKFPLKGRKKYVVMLAPSYIVDFSYPEIIFALRKLGFDKVVELTFGAKMVNREYHSILEHNLSAHGFWISSVCPGIVDLVSTRFPQYRKNLIPVDSPMIAMAKIVRKTYSKHGIVFISPCNFKKIEAKDSGVVDYAIDYSELMEIFRKKKISLESFSDHEKAHFDKFYNDYTKVYPLAGGLSKTARLKGLLKRREIKKIDGAEKVIEFLENPSIKTKFLDANFCEGACIGGPCIYSKKLSLRKRRRKVLKYLNQSKREEIPKTDKGLVKCAEGINFRRYDL
ncbi:Uncharacterised protein [uncultured archaeon]|nr:Uncharacterised protein [uncultured archaeon]